MLPPWLWTRLAATIHQTREVAVSHKPGTQPTFFPRKVSSCDPVGKTYDAVSDHSLLRALSLVSGPMAGNTTLPPLEGTTFEEATYLPTPCPLAVPTRALTQASTLVLFSVALRQPQSTQSSRMTSAHSCSKDSACRFPWSRRLAKAAAVA